MDKKWIISKVISKGDYNYAVVWDHPFATKNGYVLEHRVIVENAIGRLLDKSEVVHHKNGDKKDNRLSNLEVMTRSNHSKLHAKKPKLLTFTCDFCGNEFIRKYNQRPKVKGTAMVFCSRSCNGKFNGFKKKV